MWTWQISLLDKITFKTYLGHLKTYFFTNFMNILIISISKLLGTRTLHTKSPFLVLTVSQCLFWHFVQHSSNAVWELVMKVPIKLALAQQYHALLLNLQLISWPCHTHFFLHKSNQIIFLHQGSCSEFTYVPSICGAVAYFCESEEKQKAEMWIMAQ